MFQRFLFLAKSRNLSLIPFSLIFTLWSTGMANSSSSFYNYWNYYFTHLGVFHTSVSRWFLIGGWVTESLFKSPELFSVFWLVLLLLLMAILLYKVFYISDSIGIKLNFQSLTEMVSSPGFFCLNTGILISLPVNVFFRCHVITIIIFVIINIWWH